MIEQLHALGAIVATIAAATASAEMPLLIALLQPWSQRAQRTATAARLLVQIYRRAAE